MKNSTEAVVSLPSSSYTSVMIVSHMAMVLAGPEAESKLAEELRLLKEHMEMWSLNLLSLFWPLWISMRFCLLRSNVCEISTGPLICTGDRGESARSVTEWLERARIRRNVELILPP